MKRMEIYFLGCATEVLILPKWYKIKGCGGWMAYENYEKLLEFLYDGSRFTMHNQIYEMRYGVSATEKFKDLFDIRRAERRRKRAVEKSQ
jgi:hypothetical protein